MPVTPQESKTSVHVTTVGVSFHSPDGIGGSNVGAGDIASHPSAKSNGKPATQVTVGDVRVTNPA